MNEQQKIKILKGLVETQQRRDNENNWKFYIDLNNTLSNGENILGINSDIEIEDMLPAQQAFTNMIGTILSLIAENNNNELNMEKGSLIDLPFDSETAALEYSLSHLAPNDPNNEYITFFAARLKESVYQNFKKENRTDLLRDLQNVETIMESEPFNGNNFPPIKKNMLSNMSSAHFLAQELNNFGMQLDPNKLLQISEEVKSEWLLQQQNQQADNNNQINEEEQLGLNF